MEWRHGTWNGTWDSKSVCLLRCPHFRDPDWRVFTVHVCVYVCVCGGGGGGGEGGEGGLVDVNGLGFFLLFSLFLYALYLLACIYKHLLLNSIPNPQLIGMSLKTSKVVCISTSGGWGRH